jgi:hypothetical protein
VSRLGKLKRRLAENPRAIRFEELVRVLEKVVALLEQQESSHEE